MSNLTSCPDCDHKVSRSAARCPNCGRPAPNPLRLTASVLMVFLGVLVWGAWTQSMLNPPDSLQRQFSPLTTAADEAHRCIVENICKPVPSP